MLDTYHAAAGLDDAGLARIAAAVQAESAEANSNWSAETDGLPPDCFIGAIGGYWLQLNELTTALGAAGPTSSDRTHGREAVAQEMARFEREAIAPFAACQSQLSTWCASR